MAVKATFNAHAADIAAAEHVPLHRSWRLL
jgi:hypothetical protein